MSLAQVDAQNDYSDLSFSSKFKILSQMPQWWLQKSKEIVKKLVSTLAIFVHKL